MRQSSKSGWAWGKKRKNGIKKKENKKIRVSLPETSRWFGSSVCKAGN